MNAKQRKKLDTFMKAVAFIQTHPPLLDSAPSGFAKQVQILTDVVATIQEGAPDRGSGKPAKTAVQRAILREGLRLGQLQPLRRVARVLGKDIVGLPKLLNVRKSAGTQSLLDAAQAAVCDIAPYQEQFVDKGVAPDFLDKLSASIRAIETAGIANMQANLARANARGVLRKAFEDGTDALTLADSVIRHSCNADPVQGMAVLTVWNTIIPPRGRLIG
jgi:hypothetical protein